MRLLSLLVLVGFASCRQEPQKNTTTISEKHFDQQTQTSFSTRQNLPEKTHTARLLSEFQKTTPVSSSYSVTSLPEDQYEIPEQFDPVQFTRSVQQFVATSRSEVLSTERPEVFMLQPEQLATINTTNGTVITIHTSDLETIDGKPVTGMIKFQVKEMLSTTEMLKMHAPTTSNGEILETGGSWHISATAGGRQLQMKEGKEYSIQLPLEQKKEQAFDVFYGSTSADGTVNWQQADATFETPMINQLDIVPAEISTNQPRRKNDKLSFTSKGLMTEAPYSYYGSFVHEYIEVGADRFDAQILKNVRKRGKHAKYKPAAGLEDEIFLRMYVRTGGMSVYKDGDTTKYVFHPKAGGYSYKLVIDSLALAAESKVLTEQTKKIIGQKISRNLAKMAKERDAYIERAENKNSFQKAVTRATASLSRFGWINCDRFFKKDERIEYYTSIRTEERADALVVYMIFKNIKSILNSNYSGGGGFAFNAVPANEEVRLVAIGKSGDQLLYAQTDYFKLQKDQPGSLQLQKITTGEMTTKINALQ